MSWAADAYDQRAADLDDHMATCGSCSSGTACGDGDATAEAEFRAYRQLQRTDADEAHERRGRSYAR